MMQTQTLLMPTLFTGVLGVLAWGLRRWQHKKGGMASLLRFPPDASPAASAPLRVLSSVALGPQQRVVAVQMGKDAHATRLLLGVTAQRIECLYVLGQAPQTAPEPQAAAAAQSPVTFLCNADCSNAAQAQHPQCQSCPLSPLGAQ